MLVADDNPVSQAMAVLALEAQGHEVVQASDGETVLQLVAEPCHQAFVRQQRIHVTVSVRGWRRMRCGRQHQQESRNATDHGGEGSGVELRSQAKKGLQAIDSVEISDTWRDCVRRRCLHFVCNPIRVPVWFCGQSTHLSSTSGAPPGVLLSENAVPARQN